MNVLVLDRFGSAPSLYDSTGRREMGMSKRVLLRGGRAARTDVVAQPASCSKRTLRGLLEADGSLGGFDVSGGGR